MKDEITMEGLVLAGGKSKRMGSDKSLLVYYQKPQRYHLADMLSTLGVSTTISINKKQTQSQEYNYIVDQYKNCGSLGGILSAMEANPDHACLILACDYPLIRPFDIQQLIYKATESKKSVAYYANGMYFPSIAIYYPEMIKPFLLALKNNNFRLQDILKREDVTKLKPLNLERFISADTPEVAEKIKKELKGD